MKKLWFSLILGIVAMGLYLYYFDMTRKVYFPPLKLKRLAWETAHRYQVDANLLFAIIHQESRWNPNSLSPKGAIGLMQIMPTTGRTECGLTVKQLFEPHYNLDCGTRYFVKMLKRFGSVRLALCAYNAGPTRVANLGRCPQFKETLQYTHNILMAWQGHP